MSNQEAPVDKFVFSIKAAQTAKKDLDMRIGAGEERIERLVDRVQINGIPVLAHILSLTTNKSDLELLGKAVLRASEIVPELTELKKKRSILDFASEDISWLMGTVGDFSDFESDLDKVTWDDLSKD